jgi:hypothetical protein
VSTYLHLTLIDGFDRTTTKRFELTEQVLWADLLTNAELVMTELMDVTDLDIVKAVIQTDQNLTVPSQDPAGSNVDVGATFSGYLGDGAGKKGSLKIPGFPLAKVGPQGVIDLTDADVAAFLDLFGDPPDNKVQISDGEWVDEWISGTLDK